MSVFQGFDGELRIYDYGNSGNTTYMKVLFCAMDLSAPLARPKTDESLILDRGVLDSNSHYVQGSEEVKYGPLSLSFSCRLADTVDSRALSDWVAGVTQLASSGGGTTTLYSWSGHTTMGPSGVSVPSFEDTSKMTYRVEIVWDGTNDLAYRYDNVFFKPGESTVNESEEAVTLNASGEIYGDVSRITAFTSGSGVSAFA